MEWIAPLHPVQQITGSDIRSETGYPDWGLSSFFPVPPEKRQDSTLNQATSAYSHILSSSLLIEHPIIPRYSFELQKASLNKQQNNLKIPSWSCVSWIA